MKKRALPYHGSRTVHSYKNCKMQQQKCFFPIARVRKDGFKDFFVSSNEVTGSQIFASNRSILVRPDDHPSIRESDDLISYILFI